MYILYQRLDNISLFFDQFSPSLNWIWLEKYKHLAEGGFLYGSQLYKFEDIDKMPELGRINLLHNIKKSTLAMDGELYRALKQLEYVKDE